MGSWRPGIRSSDLRRRGALRALWDKDGCGPGGDHADGRSEDERERDRARHERAGESGPDRRAGEVQTHGNGEGAAEPRLVGPSLPEGEEGDVPQADNG